MALERSPDRKEVLSCRDVPLRYARTLHHVIARGIERGFIVVMTRTKAFVVRLGKCTTTGTSVYGWALLPESCSPSPPKRQAVCPHSCGDFTGHAIAFNRRHDWHGHLFENRYKSILNRTVLPGIEDTFT
jgi:hypothetical protein